MGLFVVRARFPSRPPSKEELLAEMVQWAGSSGGVDSIRARGEQELEIFVDMDPVTRVYLIRILLDREGQVLDFGTGEVRKVTLPEFAMLPWSKLSVLKRILVRLGFYVGWGRSIFGSSAQP
jgi:hypothetical protein